MEFSTFWTTATKTAEGLSLPVISERKFYESPMLVFTVGTSQDPSSTKHWPGTGGGRVCMLMLYPFVNIALSVPL